MSRVGKNPVPLPSGVTATVAGPNLTIKGPLGELKLVLPASVQAAVDGGKLKLASTEDTRRGSSLHGLTRNLVANMVLGVTKGYSKTLMIEGVGFRAVVQGKKLSLSLGFASPVAFAIADGVKVVEEGGTKVTVSGTDKQLVGDTAARIRSYFPVEPYKGKGIRYDGEHVKRKVGKTVA